MSTEKQQLLQKEMIERVRELCHEEDRLVAAMMYGSFAQGEGDEFSDIEFILFFDDDALRSVDQEGWVSRIAPYDSAWSWGRELMPVLAEKHEVALPEAILERLDQRQADVGQGLPLE